MKDTACIISVVTICYNCKTEIRKTIDSVLGQDYSLVDYVIIDGKSTDGTMDIVNEYKARITTVVCEPDSGIYNAMNKGIAHCKGDYVIFMNAGDVFASSNVLSKVITQISQTEREPALVYGTYKEDNNNVVVPNRSHTQCWYGMFASHQSMFYNLDFLRKHNINYDESYRIAADYKMTLQVVKEGEHFLQLQTCIAQFDTNGISCNNPQLGMTEACKARMEVLGYNRLQNFCVKTLITLAHVFRHYFTPLYKMLRYQ